MLIFLSWSGLRSRAIAEALKEWIPDVFSDVQTWMSEKDIDAGARWSPELAKKLDECDFGIACVTPENQSERWLLFECGALAKALDRSKLIPFLLEMTPSDVPPPLGQFQGVPTTRDGTFKLLESINNSRAEPKDEQQLKRVMERNWKALEDVLGKVQGQDLEDKPRRTDRALLEEMLSIVRTLPAKPTVFEVRNEAGTDLLTLGYIARQLKAEGFPDQEIYMRLRKLGYKALILRDVINSLPTVTHMLPFTDGEDDDDAEPA